MPLTETLIQEAIAFLTPRIRRTPLELSGPLSKIAGTPVWMKLEFLQITGSFKLRGAWFRMSRLSEAERRSGIFTCSAGNHGKAIAYAAREMNVHATICVPSSVDESKYRGMMELGADVRVSSFPGYDDTEDWALAEAAREGKPFLSAFDDYAVMAGSGGTLAHEVLEDLAEARTFVIPTGGGGLAAGFAFHALGRHADCRIVCCQHELSPGLQRSLERGRAVTRLPAVATSAGGIEGGLGRLPFEILAANAPAIAHLSEREIENAVRWMLATHQYLIEPSSAAAVAAVLEGKGTLNAPTVILLTGRNVGMKVIERILRA
jgi:threonine dehydratase